MANAEDNVSPSEDDALDVFNTLVDNSPPSGTDLPHADEVETSDQVDDLTIPKDNEPQDEETQAIQSEDGDATPEAVDSNEADPWTGASESQVNLFRNLQLENLKLNNNVRANSGRVSALTKKLDDLTRKPAEQSTAQSGGNQEVAAQDLQGKSFQEVEEEWPEVAGYVRDHVSRAVQQTQDAMRREMAPLQESHQNFAASRQAETVNSELDYLQNLHPDFREVNDSAAFNDWHSQQPESIQNLRNSQGALDNARLLDLFKFDSGKAQERSAPAPTARRTNLSDHAELPRKGAAKPQGLPDDPAEYFDLITST